MCFSATASFIASGATAIAGGVALRGAHKPWHFLIGVIPLQFAVHQAAEGVLWLSLTDPARVTWGPPAMMLYLALEQVVWPLWVPGAMLAAEAVPWRRSALIALLGIGAMVSVAEVHGLQAFPPSAHNTGGHIQYLQATPALFHWATKLGYVITIVLPLFVSSLRHMRVVALLILASLIAAKGFYPEAVASTWCFFAAAISLLLVLVVKSGQSQAAKGRSVAD